MFRHSHEPGDRSADPAPGIAPPAAIPPAPPPARPRLRIGRLVRWAMLGLLASIPVAIAWLAITAPLSRSLKPIAPPSVSLLAADGSMIARRGAIVGRPVDVRALPAHVGDAFIAIEDRRFYHHGAIDPRGIARAMWHDVRARGMREGGSTITQQLAKQVFLTADRTAARKAKEVLIAFWMEAWLSKDEILSRYLSEVYFGDNVYGLRAAARHYFDTAPEHLTIAQAALLAGLMKAPSRLAPTTNLAGAQARARLVVAAMADAGFLSRARAAAVRPAGLDLVAVPPSTDSTWFADWVLPVARARLAESGADDPAAATVRTTLDARLQRAAQAAATGAPPGAQVALVAMRSDGHVLAMVGGRDYAGSPFNRAVQARRQPGSTFKLFVYLAAFRAGMTPDSLVEDRPITIDGWSPANADRRYRGRITLRDAFARSSNVAAVRLAQKVGPAAVVRAARDLGITTPLAADASMALGTSGVGLVELDAAYAAVAGGRYPVRPTGLPDPPQSWLGWLTDRRHRLSGGERAMLLDLLSATVRQGTGRAARLSTPVYGKTGTSQDSRDALFVGFADGIVTAVWIGRDDNAPVPGVAGGGAPARIWRRFMAEATGARPLGVPVPRAVDPDAAIDLGIRGLTEGLRIGREALNLADGPRDRPRRNDKDDDERDDPDE